MNDCFSVDEIAETCPAVGYQTLTACVPVTVTPSAQVGVVTAKCCGDPVVTPGRNTCGGTKNGACTFTLTQTLCITVPVTFSAAAVVGDVYTDCVTASAENLCENCGEEE
ncbi:MAG: hypothetical protein PHD67_10715 [Oscillospiraceae bacterium]|nr:hypothetical protein [Oscillospiraceae bacterium]